MKQVNLTKRSLYFDESVTPQLERIAAEKEVSVSAVIRWAVKEYINQFFLTASSNDCTVNQPSEQPAQPTA